MDPSYCTKCPSNEVNARLRGVRYRRLQREWQGTAAIHVFPSCTVRFGKNWVAFGIRFDVISRSHFLVLITLQAPMSIREFYPVQLLELFTHGRLTLYQETKSTPEDYRALSSEPQISENFIHRIYKKKVFRPWYVYLYSTTVYINLQISKTKQCSNKKTDLRTPKQNKQKKTRNEHSKCLQTFQPNTCKSLL